MSGTLLAKIGSRTDAKCLRGCHQEGTFFHILWECSEIQPLWEAVTQQMLDTLGKKISLTPKLGVLNNWDATDLTDIEQKWAALGYLLTKRAIAIHWGLARRPPVIEWVAAMDKCMTAEKEVYKTRGCPKKWDKKWGKWNAYRGEICTSPTADMAMMQRGKSNTIIMSE